MVTVYVPAPGQLETIIRGSGIVGQTFDTGLVLIDYEGNRYDAVNLRDYGSRVRRAYERQTASYPTVARMVVPVDALVRVGTFDPLDDEVRLDVGGDELVRQWLDVEGES